MAMEFNSRICRDSTLRSHREAVERVILNMRARFGEPISLHDMADVACLSPFHFDRVFHETTGIAPSQFLAALRLEAAKRLLLTTSLSVTDVCFEVGYNSLGTFTRRFTQLVGLSPRSLRRVAECLSLAPLTAILEAKTGTTCNDPPLRCATGNIDGPTPFIGLIFIGLFDMRIPQGSPIGGTILSRPGRYEVGPLPDGDFYVLAAAMENSSSAIKYWLPDGMSLLVDSSVVHVNNGKVEGQLDLKLRLATLTDPPVLVALPSLVAAYLKHLFARRYLRDFDSSLTNTYRLLTPITY